MRPITCLALAVALIPGAAQAQHAEGHAHASPYSGMEERPVASLSASDIEALRAGNGWGLAISAELNSWPGPKHVLELQSQLALTQEQAAAVTAIFEDMRADAILAGARFIDAETALHDAFQSGELSLEEMTRLTERAGQARAALRAVHLGAHLHTRRVLTAAQVERYDQLRGYSADPCDTVPEGHDPAMWRRHNGCETG